MSEVYTLEKTTYKIETAVFCWCDGTGIGHPMDRKEGKTMKCSKCDAIVTVAILDVKKVKGDSE